MRVLAAAGLAAAAILSTAAAAQAKEPSVEIKYAVARVTVVPQDRADVQVVIKQGDSRLPLKVYRKGDRTIIDGELRHGKIRNCSGTLETATVDVRDVGKISWAQMPEVTIYTPRNVDIGAGGAVWGYIGRADSVSLANAGCGDWTVANVSGQLEVSQAGSGDVFAGNAGSLDLSVAGSGDTKLKALNGNLDVSIAGSGDIRIFGGRAPSMDVSVAGSGDVRFAGEAQKVDASFVGSGDIWVTKAGAVDKSAVGSGSVHVGPFDMKRD